MRSKRALILLQQPGKNEVHFQHAVGQLGDFFLSLLEPAAEGGGWVSTVRAAAAATYLCLLCSLTEDTTAREAEHSTSATTRRSASTCSPHTRQCERREIGEQLERALHLLLQAMLDVLLQLEDLLLTLGQAMAGERLLLPATTSTETGGVVEDGRQTATRWLTSQTAAV